MADVVKALLAAPVNAVLLVAGLAFLAVAVFRRITERLDAGPKGRLFAGLVGVILVALSLYLSMDRRTPEETAAAASTASDGVSPPPQGASYPMELPAGQEIKGEDWTYTILKISLDRHEIDQLALTFTIRMHNHTSYPTNFWNASFRLLADDVLVAPFNELNELVDSNAAKEGAVSFAIPAGTKKAALQIGKFGPDAPALPVALPTQP
jgi:Co/Zn/Cd efflux system component